VKVKELFIDDNTPSMTREDVIHTLSWSIAECKRVYKKPKMSVEENERLARLKTLIYACNVLASVLKDTDLEEMNKKITALEEARNVKA
jgi:hypothetical protein